MDWVAPGAVLAGKYALERKLGQGGMGAVWRAEHVQLKSPVAIKLIDEQIVRSPEALARFMREAQAAAALRSPHVVQILDHGADRGVPYIAMELLEGESLADRLARVGRLAPAEVANLMTEVARAMTKAHELSIVHRDLKPDNIFLVKNDEVEVTKVLDFGIAKATSGLGPVSGETRTGAILGTPHYMSPEQAEGTKLVDHRTDLWALGVIAFECLVGRRPFDSDALGGLLLAICTRPIPVPSAWGFDLPGFDAWFAKACARELNARFQSARELASELRRVVAGSEGREATLLDESRAAFAATARMETPFVAVPPTAGVPSATAPPVPRTRRGALVLGAGLVLAGVAGVALFASRKPDHDGAASAATVVPAAPASATLPTTTASAEVVSPPVIAPSGAAASVASVTSAAPEPSAAPSATARPRPPRKSEKPAAHGASASGKINLGL
ncbi:MAG TPA: protein kinase [Polyangiaceae bacterium]|nr:protein kinase [Polyangiaceae bacterium]